MKEIYVVVDEQTNSGTGLREMVFADDVSAQDYENGKLVITRKSKDGTVFTIAVFNTGHWKAWRGYDTGIYSKDERVDTSAPNPTGSYSGSGCDITFYNNDNNVTVP